MLRYAAICLILTIIMFVFGFLVTMLAGGALWLAKTAFFVFLILFIALFGIDMYQRGGKKK